MTQMIGDRQYKLKKEIVNILIDKSFEEELSHSLDLLKLIYRITENVKSRIPQLLMLRKIG